MAPAGTADALCRDLGVNEVPVPRGPRFCLDLRAGLEGVSAFAASPRFVGGALGRALVSLWPLGIINPVGAHFHRKGPAAFGEELASFPR